MGEGLTGEGLTGEGLAGEGLTGEGLTGEGLTDKMQKMAFRPLPPGNQGGTQKFYFSFSVFCVLTLASTGSLQPNAPLDRKTCWQRAVSNSFMCRWMLCRVLRFCICRL